MKFYFVTILAFIFASCSSVNTPHPQDDSVSTRTMAQDTACNEIAKKIFMSENYKFDLNDALIKKNLITFTEKKALIHYPKLEWINRARNHLIYRFVIGTITNIPLYLFNKEEIIPTIKIYRNIDQLSSGSNLSVENEDLKKAKEIVSSWKIDFQNYQNEIDQLIEERISLQYNMSLLKKLKLEGDGPRDIQIILKEKGEFKNEIITLRKEDKNQDTTLNNLKMAIKDLDGTLLKNGRIKDRIVRQAMLLDILTILHREMEHLVKNTSNSNIEAIKELENISQLIKNSNYSPSTYGVFKIENKKFIKELVVASKANKIFSKIANPLVKLKTILFSYFQNKFTGSTEEKIGLLKRIYTKITGITLKQASIGGGVTVVAAIGFERYFSTEEKSINEVDELSEEFIDESTTLAHKNQLERTQEAENTKDAEHSRAIETSINELINP